MTTKRERIARRKAELDRQSPPHLAAPIERRGVDWAHWARATFEVEAELRREAEEAAAEEEDENVFEAQCPMCLGPGYLLGGMEPLRWYRCRNCGMDFNQYSRRAL